LCCFIFSYMLKCAGLRNAKKSKRKSQSGIYHIILRGINQQIIFEEDEDYQKFLDTTKDYQEISGYEIYGYCLRTNHIHLLLKEGKEDLGILFKTIVDVKVPLRYSDVREKSETKS